MRPYLGDQLDRDEETQSVKIEWSPDGEEPRLHCWLDVTCETPGGEETVSFMFCDGAYVRDHLFVDYVEGGHFYRYGWMPENHIWIEDIMSLMDRVCTGVHEIHERFRMKYLGWSYDRAHVSACKIERIVRRLVLERDYILPTVEDIAQMFTLEGSGKGCESFARKAMTKNEDKLKEANRQSNNSVGRSE